MLNIKSAEMNLNQKRLKIFCLNIIGLVQHFNSSENNKYILQSLFSFLTNNGFKLHEKSQNKHTPPGPSLIIKGWQTKSSLFFFFISSVKMLTVTTVTYHHWQIPAVFYIFFTIQWIIFSDLFYVLMCCIISVIESKFY